MFMAPFELNHEISHALAESSPVHHGHFQPTIQRRPQYSASIVPFFWLMRKNLNRFGDEFDIDVDEAREPELGFSSNWVHEVNNQSALLECFAGHLKRKDSLCFFYAKLVPFIEETNRILIGVGRVKEIGQLSEFDFHRNSDGRRAMIWDRPFQHTIDPSENDGFLLPYHELLQHSADNLSIEFRPYTAYVVGHEKLISCCTTI